MARERRSKRLTDSLSITVQQLPPMKAMRLMHRLARALGPALAAAGKGSTVGNIMDTDLGNLSEAVALLFDRLSADDLEEVTRQLFEETTVTIDGKEAPLMPVFDQVFGGRIDLIGMGLVFALETNYGNLIDPIRAKLAARVAEGKSNSLQTSASSGQPTA